MVDGITYTPTSHGSLALRVSVPIGAAVTVRSGTKAAKARELKEERMMR
jgi:hypothetical protein